MLYFSGLLRRKISLIILDRFVVINTLLTIFCVQQIVQNRRFFRIFEQNENGGKVGLKIKRCSEPTALYLFVLRRDLNTIQYNKQIL